MFEHEMLFTPATVQRPIYAARNDDVHLRLRVKLSVLDHAKKQHQDIREGGMRKRPKNSASVHEIENNSDSNIPVSGNSGRGEDTEMVSGTQEIENKGAQSATAMTISTAQDANTEGARSTISGGDHPPSARSTEQSQRMGSKTIVTRQYQLCQYGHPEPGRTVVVRSAILVKIHGDAFGFLTLLGYGFEDEFVRRGYNFMYNNICRISVYRKYKLSKQHDPFSAIVPEGEAAGGQAAEAASPWLVEITSSFVSQENVNTMSEEISAVRNLLSGSVVF
ncbi:hypothetical protein BGZ98_007373 [Dissophora globulifera]|nr:hypothetical protein BGZ98_007373 [Dissophora globulifera]